MVQKKKHFISRGPVPIVFGTGNTNMLTAFVQPTPPKRAMFGGSGWSSRLSDPQETATSIKDKDSLGEG